MQMNSSIKSILISRHYLVTDEPASVNYAYLNAYLMSNFGIIVDKPNLLTKDMVKQISEKFHLTVPKSFYENPQNTLLFTKDELLIGQLVSYFVGYGSDIGRIELFKKDFPEYVVGDELKLRTFYIVNEEEAAEILRDITNAYCAYTRPFSLEELDEFMILFNTGYYSEGTEIKCKDNIFTLLPIDISFARFLDKKDVVKLSIKKFGDKASFTDIPFYDKKQFTKDLSEIALIIPYVKHCPMSKKQAKYFNKIAKLCGSDRCHESNIESPDKFALHLMNNGDVVGAAKIYASSGSMLERRLKMLLSRATLAQAVEIINMIKAENPVVLYQLMSTLSSDDGDKPRTFTFFSDNKVKTHRETEYETTWRKSKLSETTSKFLADILLEKIKAYYKNLTSLGKVYVADNFYKLGMPTNTSASGKGIDVLPIGSRIPCTGNAIRTFVHWKDAFDIDSSLIVVDKDNNLSTMGWFNYSYGSALHDGDILFSGDITGRNGAEYFDIKLDELAAKGYKYVIQTFHGYCSKLDSGEIYAGYQNKDNLKTKAWDPKNIETQFRVLGDSRGCIAFAIDIQNREMIILNQIVESDDRVVRPAGFNTIEKYLQPDYLKVNIGMIAECRGELVDNPSAADVVFDDNFVPEIYDENGELRTPAEVIRSWELEKLVALVNS
jgi:hypothetical protein